MTAIVFAIILHKTTFGREIYAIGKNPTASRYSGVKVDRIKIIVFMLAGLMASVTAVFLSSRMGVQGQMLLTCMSLMSLPWQH